MLEEQKQKHSIMNKAEMIKGLKLKIRDCDSGIDEVSWGMEDGILISKNDAIVIVSLLESEQSSEDDWEQLVQIIKALGINTAKEIFEIRRKQQ